MAEKFPEGSKVIWGKDEHRLVWTIGHYFLAYQEGDFVPMAYLYGPYGATVHAKTQDLILWLAPE